MGTPKDISVAVGYDTGMPAPIVLARGRGGLAEAIRRIAASCDIAVVAEPELAKGLIDIDPGSFIPEEYYRIIAELLVFVGRVGDPGVSRRHVAGAPGEEATAQ